MISVIVPVYRVEPYIERCIRAIQAQSLKDWELLLVNDASPDASMDIARRIAETDSRIRILDRETNRGVAFTRNEGIAAAGGEWLAFCDGDDWYEPSFLEKLLRAAENEGADLAVCDYRLASEGRAAIPAGSIKGLCTAKKPEERLAFGNLSCCSKLVHRSLLLRCARFAEGSRHYEELPAVGGWLVRSRKTAIVDEALYNYFQRRDGSSASTARQNRRTEEDYLRGLRLLTESIGTEGGNALSYLTVYALFYGEIMALAKEKATARVIKERISSYKQRFPEALDCPLLQRMPLLKRLFIFFVRKEQLLPVRLLARGHSFFVG